MGLPSFMVGRGVAAVIAVLVPLALAVAIAPAVIMWPLLNIERQDRLYRFIDLIMRRTRDMVERLSSGKPEPDGRELRREP